LSHARKTFAVGFIMTAQSISATAKDLLYRSYEPYLYVLPYKTSQDHLELLFSCIRGRGGRNNNPNVVQLKYSLRQILLHNHIRASKQSNCLVLDEKGHGSLFEISRRKAPLVEKDEIELATEALLEDEMIEEMMGKLDDESLSDLTQNILYYIAGFVVRKLKPKITCLQCNTALQTSHVSAISTERASITHQVAQFSAYINHGGLIFASVGVFRIVECAEKCFRLLVLSNKNKITKQGNLVCSIVNTVSQKLNVDAIFPTLKDHYTATELGIEDIHGTQLIKAIANKYARIRLMTYSQRHSREIVQANKPSIRHKNLKLTLFNHV